jgi:small-conductance mechanosensitive channel/CRP-like cAMP-binding protein
MRLALRVVIFVILGWAYWATIRGAPAFIPFPRDAIFDEIVGVGFWLSGAWLLTELLRLFLGYQARRRGLEMPRLLYDLGFFVIFFAAALAIMGEVFELSLSGLLFTSGILAAVIGFAVQPTATDLLAGISLNMQGGRLRIGDWIKTSDGLIGRAVEITWSETHLETFDGRLIVLRNNQLVGKPFTNFNLPTRPFQIAKKITLGFETPAERVALILQTAMDAVPDMIKHPPPYVLIEDLTDTGIVYSMNFWVPDYPASFFVADKVVMNALKFLDQAGYAPAYPRRVHIADAQGMQIERRVDVGAILRRVPLFQSFGDEEIEQLAQAIALQHFAPGAVIVREGDSGASLFVVVSGLLDVTKQTNGIEARKVGGLAPGNVFGEWSLLTGASRNATVAAVTETTLVEIGKSQFEPILTGHTEIIAELSRIEAERTARNVSALAFTPAEQKVIESVGLASFLRDKIMSFFGGG